MAKLYTPCVLATTLLFSFVLPTLQAQLLPSSRCSFSLQLHLQPSSSSSIHTHSATQHQPLTLHFFGDQPLSLFDNRSHAYVTQAGSAYGLYLADPAAPMQLRYLFCTLTVRHEGNMTANKGGSIVLMGSLDTGAVAVIGGTGSFAYASGQAKVSMAAAGSNAEQLSVYLHVELEAADESLLTTI